jgi:outer membrane protein TolC
MMRWFAGLSGFVLAVCLATGCNRQCFLSKEVFDEARTSLLPPSKELDYTLPEAIQTDITPPPPTVLCPDRPPRYLCLQEAIAIALETGTASTRTLQGANGPGSGLYDQSMFQTPPLTGAQTGNLAQFTDYVRVLALNPAASGLDMEAALSRFDANWISSMNWTVQDNLLQGLGSFSNGVNPATLQTSIVKMLASGGFVSTTLTESYTLLSQPPATVITNPQYTTSLTFAFEQPLLRNFGVRINQLLSGSPTPLSPFGIPGNIVAQYSQRQNGPLQGGQFVSNDGILIARLRFDQNRADFERVIQGLVLQVEVAYWNLYNAYGQLYSFEESLRIAHRAWMIAYAQLQASKISAAEYAPVRGQFEDFRTQRAQAMGLVLDGERNLRFILGLPPEDGCRLVPCTPPTLAHLCPDWSISLQDALNLRPELVLARDNLRLAQYNLEVAENFMKPDLRFAANYQPIGFGTRLDGRGTFVDANGAIQPSNSLRSLIDGHFANWTIGMNLNVPLGFRLESAGVRLAKIAVAQNYYLIKDQEQKATYTVQQQYQKLQEWYKRIETTRAARKAYAEAVDVRFKKIVAGSAVADISFLDFQTKLSTAQVAEYGAIAEYNNSLARFEWSKGTILKYDNVHIAEGQLPQCAQVRAVEHEKERSHAIVLRERPDPLMHPGRLTHGGDVPPMETPAPLPFEQPPSPLNPTGEPGSVEKLEVMPRPQPVEKPAEVVPRPAEKPAALAPPPASMLLPGPNVPVAPTLEGPVLPPAEPAFKATPPSIVPPQLPALPTTGTIGPMPLTPRLPGFPTSGAN